MSSKNIAVRKDVYDALRKDRRVGESFTEAILRLMNQKGSLDELAGAWGPPSGGRDHGRRDIGRRRVRMRR
jgi:predicted CopG family antitoxin